MTTQEQASARKTRLNAGHQMFVLGTTEFPISQEHVDNLKAINTKLRGMVDHVARNKAAERHVGDLYAAFGKSRSRVGWEATAEVMLLQLASALVENASFAPVLISNKTRGGKAAGLAFGLSVLLFAAMPYLSLMVFNAAFWSFDPLRKTGQPRRSRQLESIQQPAERGGGNLIETLESVVQASDDLQRALTTPGEDVAAARGAGKAALEKREKREAFNNSFYIGKATQAVVSGLKQLLFYLAQWVVYAKNAHCSAGQLGFNIQLYALEGGRALQAGLAVYDKQKELNAMTAANLAYTHINGVEDIRDMWNAHFVQQSWAAQDVIEKRIDAKLDDLAGQFPGVNISQMRQFDVQGGFNHRKYCAAPTAADRQLWSEFSSKCEGTPVPGCNGAMDELQRLVVLEELHKLHVLENFDTLLPEARKDLEKLDMLSTLQHWHAEAEGSPEAEGEPRVIDLDDLKRTLDVGDRQAQALLDRPLPEAFVRQKEGLERSFENLRVTFGMQSVDEAKALLRREGGLPPNLVAARDALQKKYDASSTEAGKEASFRELRDVLGLRSVDAAKGLRTKGLDGAHRTQLHALQNKYETRTELAPETILDVPRAGFLKYPELARALVDDETGNAKPLTKTEEAVLGRLKAKSFKSSLNHEGWVRPVASGHPDVDKARRDKSLTPFEHLLLQTLEVRPRVDARASAEQGRTVTNHDLLDQRLNAVPASMARVHAGLAELRDVQVDKLMRPWDWSQLTEPTTQAIENMLLHQKGVLGNLKDMVPVRWNMPGYVVPLLTVNLGRATFMGPGGSGFQFLLGTGTALARRLATDTFQCDRQTGPNKASNILTFTIGGIATVCLIPQLLNAIGAPFHAESTARVRLGYFTRPGGRPTMGAMLKSEYWYAARRVVTDPVMQLRWRGPSSTEKTRLKGLLTQADAHLARLAQPPTARTAAAALAAAPERIESTTQAGDNVEMQAPRKPGTGTTNVSSSNV
ncbi:hypothetical protein [Piscinibacter sp.]|uniref:hypothetical protein n=1 Tax=Piscinibacter sp. TaxID=1903157 RepID=UPI002ED29088